ncbi:MTH1187 family thiamine-binding protein [Candidatus Pacearchaeota archaeon]|nr:MTH1187 family thiamine-binding protein [Candidatus Pacearchaeota archaeon]
MIAAISIEPIGQGRSLSKYIARVTEIVEQSGLEYQLNNMNTEVYGEWGEVMDIVEKCHYAVLKEAGRVITHITIDERSDKKYGLGDKIRAVERILGREVKK